MPFSLGLDGDEAVVHGAVLYGLSRHEPAALGRSITLVEDDLSTEAAGAGEGRGGSKLPKQLAGSAPAYCELEEGAARVSSRHGSEARPRPSVKRELRPIPCRAVPQLSA